MQVVSALFLCPRFGIIQCILLLHVLFCSRSSHTKIPIKAQRRRMRRYWCCSDYMDCCLCKSFFLFLLMECLLIALNLAHTDWIATAVKNIQGELLFMLYFSSWKKMPLTNLMPKPFSSRPYRSNDVGMRPPQYNC